MSAPKVGPRTLAGLVIVLTFLVGGLAGAVTDRTLHGGRQFRVGPPGPNPGGGPDRDRRARGRERFIQEMKRNLDLTPDQVAKIEAISLEREQRVDSLLKDVRPKVRALLDETRKEIDGVLTPEQRARAQALWRQHEEARRKAGPGGPGHGMDSTGGNR